jgi:hypothetical protein
MKGFDCGLFPNTYKKGQNDPDATGSLRIPASVIAELYQGISGGTIPLKPGYGDGAEPFVELRAAAWRGDGSLTATGKQRPAISVRFDSPPALKLRSRHHRASSGAHRLPAAGAALLSSRHRRASNGAHPHRRHPHRHLHRHRRPLRRLTPMHPAASTRRSRSDPHLGAVFTAGPQHPPPSAHDQASRRV